MSKTTFHYCFTIIFFSLGFNASLFSQAADTFKISELQSKYFHFELDPSEVLSTPAEGNNTPRWGAYWIFPDGHVHYESDNGRGPVSNTVYYPGLRFPNNEEDIIVASYLTKKYSNTTPPPPDGLVNIVNETGNSGIPTSTFYSIIPPGKNVKLETNHYARKNHEILFNTSYQLKDFQGNGSIYLFYNALLLDNNDFQKAQPAAFEYKRSHLPFYLKEDQTTPIADLNQYPITGIGDIANKFSHAVVHKYENGEWANPDRGLLDSRIFHALHTREDILNNYLIDAQFVTLAVATNNAITNAKVFDDDSYSKLFNRLGVSRDENDHWILDGAYVIDIDSIHLVLKASHDPNSLCFGSVCKCSSVIGDCSRPYLVKMNLKICNTGNEGVNKIEIELKDSDRRFTDFKINSVNGIDGGIGIQADVDLSQYNNAFEEDFTIPLSDFNLPPPYDAQGNYRSSCINISFTIETDESGVEQLISQEGSLTATIDFREGPIFTAINDYCYASLMHPKNKKKTYQFDKFQDFIDDTPFCKETKYIILLISFLLFFLLIGTFRWFYTRNKKNNKNESTPKK